MAGGGSLWTAITRACSLTARLFPLVEPAADQVAHSVEGFAGLRPFGVNFDLCMRPGEIATLDL